MSVKTKILVPFGIICIGAPAMAQDTAEENSASPFELAVTEEKAPSSKPWEKPANLSFEIDPNGKDRINVDINVEAKHNLAGKIPAVNRQKFAGGYLRWNKDTKEKKEQDNFEAGLVFELDYKLTHALSIDADVLRNLTAEQRSQVAEARARRSDFAHKFTLGYAKTAEFPKLESEPCNSTPTMQQCSIQHKESVRASYASTFFNVNLENRLNEKLVYSISPQFGADYDHLINSPIDTTTGLVANGGYLSGLVGVAAIISPEFVNPGWEFNASGQVRQSFHTDSTRKAGIESTAEKFSVGATYFVVRPKSQETSGWRAGIGMEYSNGGDPLAGKKDEERIIISFKLGRY